MHNNGSMRTFEINNKFDIFSVVASGINVVSITREAQAKQDLSLSSSDIFFSDFSRLFLNKPTSVIKVKYKSASQQRTGALSAREAKDISVDIGIKLCDKDRSFTMALRLAWDLLLCSLGQHNAIAPLYAPFRPGNIRYIHLYTFINSFSFTIENALLSGAFFVGFTQFADKGLLALDSASEDINTIDGANKVRTKFGFYSHSKHALSESFVELIAKEFA